MDTKTIELIDKFLNKELDTKALHEFEKQIQSNPEFAREVKLHEEINKALKEKDVMSFRNQLQSIHDEHNKTKTAGRIIHLFHHNTRLVSGVAAAVIVLIVVGSILVFGPSAKLTTDNLFADYYEADDAVMMTRSGSNPEDIDLKEALLAYHEKKYDHAIELLHSQTNNILAKYYLGLSYLETDNIDNAITTFEAIIDHKNNLFIEQAEWYLSLCYIKNNEDDKAKEMLNKIINSKSIYKEKAENILKRI